MQAQKWGLTYLLRCPSTALGVVAGATLSALQVGEGPGWPRGDAQGRTRNRENATEASPPSSSANSGPASCRGTMHKLTAKRMVDSRPMAFTVLCFVFWGLVLGGAQRPSALSLSGFSVLGSGGGWGACPPLVWYGVGWCGAVWCG